MRKFKNGKDFERWFCGETEGMIFPFSKEPSFGVNLANAILAQPKGHDTQVPSGDPLHELFVDITSGVPIEWKPYMRVFVCLGLPTDILDGVDVFIACLHPDVMSMVTIDLTYNTTKIVQGRYKSDFLVTPKDCRQRSKMSDLSLKMVRFLLDHKGNIPQETIDIVNVYNPSVLQGSG